MFLEERKTIRKRNDANAACLDTLAAERKEKAKNQKKIQLPRKRGTHITEVVVPISSWVHQVGGFCQTSRSNYLRNVKFVSKKDLKIVTGKTFIEKWRYYMDPNDDDLLTLLD